MFYGGGAERLGGARSGGVRVLIGIVLLAAALTKLFAMDVFQAVLALFDLVPGPAAPVVAWGVSLSEAGVGLLLILGNILRPNLRERALWGAAPLLTSYLTYDLCRLVFDVTLPGPYFGVWSALPPAGEAAVAAILLSLVVWVLGCGTADTSAGRSRALTSSATAFVACVLCMFGAVCHAEDVTSVTKGMRRAMGPVRSVGARITITTQSSRGYVASLYLEPGKALLSRREIQRWQKGSRWRVDERRASEDRRTPETEEVTTFLFDGRGTVMFSNYRRREYTRGTFLEAETPIVFTPLTQAYHVRGGRDAPDVLETDAFTVAASGRDPVCGRVCRLDGHEFGKTAFTTTVVVALDRGYQIVRSEFRSNRMGRVIAVSGASARRRRAPEPDTRPE